MDSPPDVNKETVGDISFTMSLRFYYIKSIAYFEIRFT